MMVEISSRLQLRYNPGQFSFSRFAQSASDEALYDLARQLNCFQEEEPEQIVRIQVMEYRH